MVGDVPNPQPFLNDAFLRINKIILFNLKAAIMKSDSQAYGPLRQNLLRCPIERPGCRAARHGLAINSKTEFIRRAFQIIMVCHLVDELDETKMAALQCNFLLNSGRPKGPACPGLSDVSVTRASEQISRIGGGAVRHFRSAATESDAQAQQYAP